MACKLLGSQVSPREVERCKSRAPTERRTVYPCRRLSERLVERVRPAMGAACFRTSETGSELVCASRTPRQERLEPCLVEDLRAELLRFAQLRARLGADHQVGGLPRYRVGHRAAQLLD